MTVRNLVETSNYDYYVISDSKDCAINNPDKSWALSKSEFISEYENTNVWDNELLFYRGCFEDTKNSYCLIFLF